VIPNAKIDSESSNSHVLDLNGYIQGQILTMTWSDEARSASWVRVEAVNEKFHFATYSMDGFFDMYLTPSSYSLSVTEWTPRGEGHIAVELNQISIPTGSSLGSFTFVLDETKVPLPEAPAAIFILSFAAVLAILTIRARSASTQHCPRSKSAGK
jgi:hypothetical protein